MARKTEPRGIDPERLKQAAREAADLYLDHPNVTSVGIGRKIEGGKPTGALCIQFTVGRKIAPQGLVEEGIPPLPKSITVDGVTIPTDVVERRYKPSWQLVPQVVKDERKLRHDPLLPGISVSHPAGTAGTLGCIVYDRQEGRPHILSNWHVLHGEQGRLGDTDRPARAVRRQPGREQRLRRAGAQPSRPRRRLRHRPDRGPRHRSEDPRPRRPGRPARPAGARRPGGEVRPHHRRHLGHRHPDRDHGEAVLRRRGRVQAHRRLRDRPRPGPPGGGERDQQGRRFRLGLARPRRQGQPDRRHARACISAARPTAPMPARATSPWPAPPTPCSRSWRSSRCRPSWRRPRRPPPAAASTRSSWPASPCRCRRCRRRRRRMRPRPAAPPSSATPISRWCSASRAAWPAGSPGTSMAARSGCSAAAG